MDSRTLHAQLAQGRRRWILPALLLIVVGGVTGCRPAGSYLRRYERIRPERYAVLLPRGREALPGISRFVEHKRRLGFAVEVIAFEPAGTPAERLAGARRLLREKEAPEGAPGYLLILATKDELPMGPWSLPGDEDPVLSDVPLIASPEALLLSYVIYGDPSLAARPSRAEPAR